MTDRTHPWYCVPCSTRERRTVRYAEERPEMPCGQGCRRIEWQMRAWYCRACWRQGRTSIVHSHGRPVGQECASYWHLPAEWVETDLSRWALPPLPAPKDPERTQREALTRAERYRRDRARERANQAVYCQANRERIMDRQRERKREDAS